MKKGIIYLLLSLSYWIQAQPVKIAAAASLRLVLEDLTARYTVLHPGTTFVVNLGATGILAQQISNGADFDLFMAADRDYPEKLKAEGFGAGEVMVYAYGKLALWSNTLDVSGGMDILHGKSVRRIALANPSLAPYGQRAVECLKAYGLYDKIKNKIVYADNISQAALFTQTGNAEVGLIAYSLLMMPEMKGSYFLPDPKTYKPVEQAFLLLGTKRLNPEAVRFTEFLLGKEGRSIFTKYGL